MSTTAAQILERETIEAWVRVAGACIDAGRASSEDANRGANVQGVLEDNSALAILRYVLGGDDTDKVSQIITAEVMDRFMDDTTIQVIRV